MRTKILSISVILAMGLFSCQTNDDADLVSSGDESDLKSTEIATSDILVESICEEADYEAEFFTYSEKLLREISHLTGRNNGLVDSKKLLHYQSGNGPDVAIDSAETGYPITITLDYGDSTILKNGKVLSGIIKIVISGDKNTDDATRTISYSDFTVDSVGVAGTMTELYTGGNDSTKISSTSGTVVFTLADGSTITRTSEKVREWLSGIDTPLEHDDDMVQVTGKVETSTSAGESFSKVITVPLFRTDNCKDYVQGVVQYFQNGTMIAELNYGDGECDGVATLTTSDGEIVEIDLSGDKPTAGNSSNHHKHSKGKN
jgi:hypothetical protein